MNPLADPLQVLARLETQLRQDTPQMLKFARYNRGEFPEPWTPSKDVDREFRTLLERSKLNLMRPVIDAHVERMRVKGFRLSASSSDSADNASWLTWQANRLDREIAKAFREALIKGRSYLSVWYPEPSVTGHNYPRIAVEDATQVIVEFEPGTSRRSAAIKVWEDDRTGDIKKFANVYLPNVIYKFHYVEVDSGVSGRESRWVEREEVITHDLGIPIIPLLNNADLSNRSESELADIWQTQERVNEMVFNRSLAGWFAANRQKWISGIDIPQDPETGAPMREWLEEMNRRLVTSAAVSSPNNETKFGNFDATDPNKYTEIIEAEKMAIAEIKRLPRHYFLKEGTSVNGQSIKAAEAGLVARVKDKMANFGEAIEDAMLTARRASGENEEFVDAEVLWSDPEHRTEGELTDSVMKQHQGGIISRQTALERLGYTPQEIERELARTEEERQDPLAEFSQRLDQQLAEVDMGDADVA